MIFRKHSFMLILLTTVLVGLLQLTTSISRADQPSAQQPTIRAFVSVTDFASEDCVIPESGPWPPCATNGSGQPAEAGDASDDCVIPDSGPWPPCATGNNPAPDSGNPPTESGNICPTSGPWPPGCTPSTGVDGGDNGSEDCVIPASGPWPPCATAGGGGGTPPATGNVEQRIYTALDQLQAYWRGELTMRNITPPTLQKFELYTGEADEFPNAYYVPIEDAIYVDTRLLDAYVAEFGQFGAVAIVAHEYAHFIQDSVGLLVNSTPGRTIELQADCLTGSFTGYLRDVGALQPGEYENALEMMYAIGDDQLSDLPVPIWIQHGDGADRQAAYKLGYENEAQTCFDSRY